MKQLDKLTERYAAYLTFTEKLAAETPRTAGLLGMGSSPKDHPGHETFYDDVGTIAAELLAAPPSEAEAFEAVRFILQAADAHQDNELAYWFLYAAQGHAKALIPLLTAEHRQELRAWYDAHYPRRTRMPVQREVYRLLKKR